MLRFLVCLLVVASLAVLASLFNLGDTSVSWKGEQAIITWKESLADPTAREGEVPYSVLTGPYLSWLTPTQATIGWEVIAEKKLSDKPYASVKADYPDAQVGF